MRVARWIGLGLLGAFVGAHLALAHSTGTHTAEPAVQVTTVTMIGEVIDPQCWFTHDSRGVEHAACATRCARGGQGLAFLEERTGKFYSLIARQHGAHQNELVLPHVGKRVQVRGIVYTKGPDSVLQVLSAAVIKSR